MPTFTLPPSPAYLVALSGGADSRLLLELTIRTLSEQEPEADPGRRIMAAHLHHGIRGAEADRDEEFCRQLCAKSGIPLAVEHADIPALAASQGESIETAARKARYDFFRRIMAEHRIPVLLTAHHADDNLETLLDRLLRGSGTKGMGGIPPTRSLGQTDGGLSLTVARPILEWTKQDILKECAALGLDFVTDSTNGETAYTRNRLRHTVIPALEAASDMGIPQRAALRLTRAAREDEDCLNELAEARVKSDSHPDGGLDLLSLQSQHPAIAKRMLAILYDRATADVDPHDGSGTLTSAHLDALCELVRKGAPKSAVSLPRGMEARIRDQRLTIRPAESPPPPLLPRAVPLGTTAWGDDVTILAESFPTPTLPAEGADVWASAVFPAELPLPLIARSREAGDLILSHGMHKKLKKLLCDKNIPPHLRDTLPLICLPDGTPLWYPNAAFRDGYPAPSEGACLRITIFLKIKRK